MIAKIFMCPSYVKNLHDEGNSYVKKLCHFYCKSTNDHDHILFILVRSPLYVQNAGRNAKNCSCKNIGPFDICKFCVQIKYLLNFRINQLCVKSITENITPHLVPLNQYLQNETVFYFPEDKNKIIINLDNPLFNDMKNVSKNGN